MGKPKTKKQRKNVGRPTVVTEEVLRKLEEAFLLGCDDELACFRANIGTTALYEYQKKNPQFAERKAMLKRDTEYAAINTLRKAIDGYKLPDGRIVPPDSKMAIEYLKRRRKDLWSERVENTGAGGVPLLANLGDDPDPEYLEWLEEKRRREAKGDDTQKKRK